MLVARDTMIFLLQMIGQPFAKDTEQVDPG